MAAASSSSASAGQEPSPLDQFKTGWKGLRSNLAKAAAGAAAAAGAGPEAELEEGHGAAGAAAESGAGEGGSSWKSVLRAAKKLVSESSYDSLREDGATVIGRPQDSEASEASETAPLGHPAASSSSTSWAKVASRMKAQVADVTEATLNVTDKVYKKTSALDIGIDIGGHAKDLTRGASSTFKGLADSAKETREALAEKGKSAVDRAKDLQG
ncbi:unnamed protein product, partial [Prorocentrum cordatum]